ncbi:MAG: Bug family tripartite tricarboxylate transporter substrate binding protein [Burkholderiales bacterium]
MRRHHIACTLAIFCGLGSASSGTAQDVAPKQVRIVVPFSAGASNDAIARAISPQLSKRLESNIVVENRPGAAGIIGADSVAKAPKDGSVLLLTSATFLTAAATRTRMPYDPLTSFTPVAIVAQNPSVLAISAFAPIRTPAQLMTIASAKPNWLTYGTPGVGSIGHLTTELMNGAAKVEMRHIPYKGAANAAIDLAGGQIDVMISSFTTLSPFVKSGKVRLLAVTSHEPHPAFPEIPTLTSVVPGVVNYTWAGVLAPAGAPSALVERLNREITGIAGSAELRRFFEPEGMLPVPLSTAGFAMRMKHELGQWKKIAAAKNIVAE